MVASTRVPLGQVRLKVRTACMGMAHGRCRGSHGARLRHTDNPLLNLLGAIRPVEKLAGNKKAQTGRNHCWA